MRGQIDEQMAKKARPQLFGLKKQTAKGKSHAKGCRHLQNRVIYGVICQIHKMQKGKGQRRKDGSFVLSPFLESCKQKAPEEALHCHRPDGSINCRHTENRKADRQITGRKQQDRKNNHRQIQTPHFPILCLI